MMSRSITTRSPSRNMPSSSEEFAQRSAGANPFLTVRWCAHQTLRAGHIAAHDDA